MSLVRRAWWKANHTMAARLARARLNVAGVELGEAVKFYGQPIVSVVPGSRIVIGDRVTLCSQSEFTALGVNHPVVLRTLLNGAELVISSDVGISGGSFCAAVSVRIGEGTLIGANVTITDTDFHPVPSLQRRYAPLDAAGRAPVSIGRNVFLGTGVIVLKGVNIGDNSVIGAGSVVSQSVPPNVIAAGNPCRVIRPLLGVQS